MPFEIPTGVDIPPGNYTATLEKVEELTGGQFGNYRKWHWLVQVDDKIESIADLTSANTGPQSRSYKRLEALLGRAPQAGEKLEDPTGSRVVLQIVKNAKGFPAIESIVPFVEPQQVLPGTPR